MNNSVKVKRHRRKKENIRPNALLPDTIRLNNHMVYSRMSSKEFNSRCKYLNSECKETITCNAHISKQKLEKISNSLNLILRQSDIISTDWIKKKVLHLGNYGYLNLAIIHPEILKEINLIKKLVKSFNKSRVNIWKYKDLITNFHKKKPKFIKIEQNLTSEKPSINNTVARLKMQPIWQRGI